MHLNSVQFFFSFCLLTYKNIFSQLYFLFVFHDLFSFGDGLLTIGPGSCSWWYNANLMADIDMQLAELLHVAGQ